MTSISAHGLCSYDCQADANLGIDVPAMKVMSLELGTQRTRHSIWSKTVAA